MEINFIKKMEIDKIKEFVECVNSISENTLELKDNLLYIKHDGDEENAIDIEEIEEIYLDRKKTKGTEIFIKTVNNSHNILFYVFENKIQPWMFIISTMASYYATTLFWPVMMFLVGAVSTFVYLKF